MPEPGSRRDAGRRAFDRLEQLLGEKGQRWPSGGMRLAAALGRLRNLLSRQWPRPGEVGRLLPDLAAGQRARVARAIAGTAACERFLIAHIRQQGLGRLPLVLQPLPEEFLALRPPLILGILHAGLVEGVWAALARLDGPVAVVRHGHLRASIPPFELVSTEGGVQRRAAAFLRTLTRLQTGGFVLTALDVVTGEGLPVPFLGRTFHFARGPFVLARRAGAPILPLTARRRGGRIEVVFGAPIPPASPIPGAAAPRDRRDAGEIEQARAVAAWFEQYLTSDPGQISLGLLRSLLAAGEPSFH